MDWRVLESEVEFRCRPFTVVRRRSRSDSLARTDDFFVLETAAWANVVPVTPDGDVICVRQFRHGVGAFTLEVPAGLIDPADVSPQAAAERELREETGYRCARLEPVGVLQPNPALFTNRCHVFVAVDATYAGPPQWDPNEEMEVVRVPAGAMCELVRAGEVGNALTVAALYLASLSPWGAALRMASPAG